MNPHRHSILLLAAALLTGCAGDSPTGGGKKQPVTPAQITVASGNEQKGTVGVELSSPLVVRVTGSDGKPMAGATVTWAVTGGDGSVASASATIDAAGQASAKWTLGTKAGENTATATVGSLAPVTFLAQGAAGAVAKIEKASGDAQTAAAGSALPAPLAVRATDAHGNRVSGAAVTWAVTGGGGAVSPAATTTDSAGLARATWTLGAGAGQQGATATVVGVAPLAFTATATAGAAAKMEKAGGDAQSGPVAAALHGQLVVKLLDTHGNPVSGASVTWQVAAGGGAVTPVIATSDTSGLARATWTLGTTAGANTVTASGAGVALSFSATGVPGPAATLTLSRTVDTLAVGATLQMAASAKDAYGNLITGPAVAWSSSSAAATVSQSGMVTAALVGTADITASLQGKSASARLVVAQPAPSTGIRIRITSPIEATNYFLGIDGGGFTGPKVVRVTTAPTKSAVLSLSVPAGGSYRVRVLVPEPRTGDGSPTVAATGKATGITVSSGSVTEVAVALERPSYSVSAPATADGGSTITVTWTVTDPGSTIDNVGFPWQGAVAFSGTAGSGSSDAVRATQVSETTYSFSASFQAPIQPGTIQVTTRTLSFANIYTAGLGGHVSHYAPSAARGESAKTITIQ
jgi:hypothetical protein